MSEPVVTYTSQDHVATITLNRPEKMNALSNGLVAELRQAFQRLQDSDDRVAVLTSAGDRAFSVGADLKDPPRDPELWECMPGVGVMLDKPVIAAVHGYCVGGAFCLVEFADLAIADETADFFYPEAQNWFLWRLNRWSCRSNKSQTRNGIHADGCPLQSSTRI